MAQMRLRVEEWGAIIEAMKAVPPQRRTPHWNRAMTALNELLSDVRDLRRRAGDIREADEIVCMDCVRPVQPGENFVFEPSDSRSYHASCWLDRAMKAKAAKGG